MNNKSIWNESISHTNYPTLDHDITVDTAIVGGGLAGILTAYYLKEAGINTVVLEKDHIGCGITSKTTAFISQIHDIKLSDRIKKLGLKQTKLFVDANTQAIYEYQKLNQKYQFDFEVVPHIVYVEKDKQILDDEMKAYNQLGITYDYLEKIELPQKICGALSIPNQAQMNPLKLINELAKTLNIYENSLVTSITSHQLIANGHRVSAKRIIVATHFPFIKRWGAFFMKMYQKASYVIAISNKEPLKAIYTGYDQDKLYFRSYHDFILIGGNDARCGFTKNAFDVLENYQKTYFPNSKIIKRFVNQDCITLDDLPYIGLYSTLHQNIYVLTGFNLWGMTQAMIGAKIITDMIKGCENKYQSLFNPHRHVINKVLGENILLYMKRLFILKNKCPHMKASLIWNEEEHTWDCPCHGSKLDQDGKILNGPTMKNLNITKNKTIVNQINE